MVLDSVDIRIVYTVIGFALGFAFCLMLCATVWWGRHWLLQKTHRERPPVLSAQESIKPTASENNFFHHMTASQQRLESLLSKAEATEQKLQHRTSQTDTPPADPYATAAFLLANGEDIEGVARKLNLSPTQVRLVQELRQELQDKGEDHTEAREEKAARIQQQVWGKNGVGH